MQQITVNNPVRSNCSDAFHALHQQFLCIVNILLQIINILQVLTKALIHHHYSYWCIAWIVYLLNITAFCSATVCILADSKLSLRVPVVWLYYRDTMAPGLLCLRGTRGLCMYSAFSSLRVTDPHFLSTHAVPKSVRLGDSSLELLSSAASLLLSLSTMTRVLSSR